MTISLQMLCSNIFVFDLSIEIDISSTEQYNCCRQHGNTTRSIEFSILRYRPTNPNSICHDFRFSQLARDRTKKTITVYVICLVFSIVIAQIFTFICCRCCWWCFCWFCQRHLVFLLNLKIPPRKKKLVAAFHCRCRLNIHNTFIVYA